MNAPVPKKGLLARVKLFKFPTFDMGRTNDQITLDFEKQPEPEAVPVRSARVMVRENFAAKVGQAPSAEAIEKAADAILAAADLKEVAPVEKATVKHVKATQDKDDFEADVPQDEVVTDGIDHFQMRGRYMMFIQMLSLVALDVTRPDKVEEYEDAMKFLNDPYGFKHMLFMIGADHRLGPRISQAVLARPQEIHQACMDVARGSQAETNSFEKFMRMMGVPENGGRSSSYIDESEMDHDESIYRP